MSGTDQVEGVVTVYGLLAAEILLLEAYEWLRDGLYARHRRTCPKHGEDEWQPRWTSGVGDGVAGSLLRAVLWPVVTVSDLLDWLEARRVKREARRVLRDAKVEE